MVKTINKSKKKRPRATKLIASKKNVRRKSVGKGEKHLPKRVKKATVSSGKILIYKVAEKLSRQLNQAAGCSGLVWIQEVGNKAKDSVTGSYCFNFSTKHEHAKKKASRVTGRSARIPDHLSEVLAAVAHPVRLRILVALLDGPAIYRSLQKLTKLKAGPLYHHINQLRLAGLILPKQRDLYELTQGGRNTILTVMSMGSITRNRRRRPILCG